MGDARAGGVARVQSSRSRCAAVGVARRLDLAYGLQQSAQLEPELARVAVGVTRTPGEVVASFLAEVDPVLLDQEALNRADYGGGAGSTARAMLATLTEWAAGKRST